MEKVLLNFHANLDSCEKALTQRLSFYSWQGIEIVSRERTVFGSLARVVFEGSVYYALEALEGFDVKVYPKDLPVLCEEKDESFYVYLGLEVKRLPSVFLEYYIMRSQLGSLKNNFGQSVQEFMDQGLEILRRLEVDELTLKAFCLSAFVKKEERLKQLLSLDLSSIDPRALVLAMEFRRLYLSFPMGVPSKVGLDLELSSMKEANEIVAAEKIVAYRGYRKMGGSQDEVILHYHVWLKRLAPFYNFKVKVLGQ